MKALLRISACLSIALAASACAGLTNGAEQAQSVAQAHPIAVDSQIVTLTISVDPTMTELSDVDQARIKAFADAYLINGHGPLTITAPSGSSTDLDGQERAADIRQALHEAGVSWSAIGGATYRTGDNPAGNDMIISYTHFVATPSACGNWQGARARDYRNMRWPNYGCATQNNIAAMIADPHDLIAPADMSPRDAMASARAFDLYRAGQDTASETSDIETQISQ